MQYRQLGKSGPRVSAVALGCMSMSGIYGPADRAESLATIRAAIDAGVTLLDTGDFYGMGHNEMLIGEAVRDMPRDSYQLSVKFGSLRGPSGDALGVDNRPEALKTALAYSLQRLGVDYIDIYRPARLDPNVPIEDTVGALSDLASAGFIRSIGLSEVGVAILHRAVAVHPIADLQFEYSLLSRDIERAILPAVRQRGIGTTAYSVLCRGLLSGRWRERTRPDTTDWRSRNPRFGDGNLEKNLTLVDALRGVAEGFGATVAEIAIAWVLAQGPDIVATIGARRRDQLDEAIRALDLTLSPSDLLAIEEAVPANAVAGSRYAPAAMPALGP